MSLTHAPDQTPTSKHPIDDDIVETVVKESPPSVTVQHLTESLNLFQALLATEHNVEVFFSSLSRPEHLHEIGDAQASGLVTPVTWWELQAHSDWDNATDCALLQAHRQQFFRDADTPEDTYTNHQLTTLHPIISNLPPGE